MRRLATRSSPRCSRVPLVLLPWTVDFTAADALPADWVCNRATPALRINAAGQIESVPANTGRITYDPVTGECLGLLREPQATNTFVGSEDWNALPSSDGTSVVTRGQGYANPIGAESVSITTKATGHTGNFYQYGFKAVTPNTANVFSFFVKPAINIKGINCHTSPGDKFYFAYSLATKVLVPGANAAWAEVQEMPQGWLRFSVAQKAADDATTQIVAVVGVPTVPADPAVFWSTGCQIHAGMATASYVKTGTAAATRAADQLCTPLGAWFNRFGGEGAMVVDLDVRSYLPDTETPYFGLNKSGGLINGQDYGLTVYAGFNFLTRNPVNVSPAAGFQRDRVRVAVSVNGDGKRICKTGGAVASNAGPGLNDMSLASVLTVGGGAQNTASMYIRRVTYYPRSLSDTEMLALTR